MSVFRSAFLAILFMVALGPTAEADIFISVDAWKQRMTVFVDGRPRYMWVVSTGAEGYTTPPGSYRALRMAEKHFSREWDDAPMPHSIFFTQRGHAIHGSSHVNGLGRPVSHGCVRLAPEKAAFLFAMVKEQGLDKTRVEVIGPKGSKRKPPRDTYEPVNIHVPREIHRQIDRWFRVLGGD